MTKHQAYLDGWFAHKNEHNDPTTRLVCVALTAAIIVILAVASHRESNPCAWDLHTPNYVCAVLEGR